MCLRNSTCPALSAPCTWNTYFAMSKPIVVACSMDASFGGSSTPSPWHIDAVGGRPPHHPAEPIPTGICEPQVWGISPRRRCLGSTVIDSPLDEWLGRVVCGHSHRALRGLTLNANGSDGWIAGPLPALGRATRLRRT